MMTELCAELRNYFIREIHAGVYKITNGNIESVPFLQDGQYFRIVGSVFNDGVWNYNTGDGAISCDGRVLIDETFRGAVWAMAVPPAVIALDQDIEKWVRENSSVLASPFMSESFGGYSYSKGSGRSSEGTEAAFGWKEQFASRLAPYRRIRVL